MSAPASAESFAPGSFDPQRHFYPRVLNAQIHPMVSFFFNMKQSAIIERFTHLHPSVDPDVLKECLDYQPRFFHWAGSDMFSVTTPEGARSQMIIETNSCPSGNKSMPLVDENVDSGGYHNLVKNVFVRLITKAKVEGGLAVIYDKNEMEASGYAAAIADATNETVHLAYFPDGDDAERSARFVGDGLLEVRVDGEWKPMRAAFRYVTQQPWNRIPLKGDTILLNPVLVCLAGGRNKAVASKAYEIKNAKLAETGLQILTPETLRDVHRNEVPLWVEAFGGRAVIKSPYGNGGQQVDTIVSKEELDRFMAKPASPYELYVIQALIGNSQWSSVVRSQAYYHVGTMPNRKNEIFVADLRMMIAGGPEGYRPVAMYARKAHKPLTKTIDGQDSWSVLGTNLSVLHAKNKWSTETDRLVLLDRKDFNSLGVSIDELIESYVQTVLSATAIDEMCCSLMDPDTMEFNSDLFKSLNNDQGLLNEISAVHGQESYFGGSD